MTTSIIAIAIIAAIAGSYTIVKSRRAAAAAIEIPDGTTVTSYSGKRIDISELPPEMQEIVGLFDEISRTATCVKDYSMSIDDRYRKKNHFNTYSSRNLLMESFTTCSLNDSDEIENEIQIFLTKGEYLCVFTVNDTASNRRILKSL